MLFHPFFLVLAFPCLPLLGLRFVILSLIVFLWHSQGEQFIGHSGNLLHNRISPIQLKASEAVQLKSQIEMFIAAVCRTRRKRRQKTIESKSANQINFCKSMPITTSSNICFMSVLSISSVHRPHASSWNKTRKVTKSTKLCYRPHWVKLFVTGLCVGRLPSTNGKEHQIVATKLNHKSSHFPSFAQLFHFFRSIRVFVVKQKRPIKVRLIGPVPRQRWLPTRTGLCPINCHRFYREFLYEILFRLHHNIHNVRCHLKSRFLHLLKLPSIIYL